MNIDDKLHVLTQYMPIEQLQRSIAMPQKYGPEQFDQFIPSFELGTDGPTLVRLLLISRAFICDVRLSPTDDDFDYIARESVFNYRVKLWRHEVHELATVTLVHGEGYNFTTLVSYVGPERGAWMDDVTSVFPASIVSKFAR